MSVAASSCTVAMTKRPSGDNRGTCSDAVGGPIGVAAPSRCDEEHRCGVLDLARLGDIEERTVARDVVERRTGLLVDGDVFDDGERAPTRVFSRVEDRKPRRRASPPRTRTMMPRRSKASERAVVDERAHVAALEIDEPDVGAIAAPKCHQHRIVTSGKNRGPPVCAHVGRASCSHRSHRAAGRGNDRQASLALRRVHDGCRFSASQLAPRGVATASASVQRRFPQRERFELVVGKKTKGSAVGGEERTDTAFGSGDGNGVELVESSLL